jgi:putative ABC transport system permease protein
VEKELDDELESYPDLVVAEEVDRGVPREEARQRALAEMGGMESVKERVREGRTGHGIDTVIQDLLFGARLLARNPAFSLLAVSTLALGVAAITAVFSVVDGVLLESLPYPEPDRLVFVGPTARDGRSSFSPPDFVDFQETTSSFEALCAIQGNGLVTLSIDGHVEPVRAREVTTSFVSVYGVHPYLGRAFGPEDRDTVAFEDRGDPEAALPKSVVLISYSLWRERFGGEPSALGRLVELDFQPYEIIGVMPPGFETLIPDEADYRAHVDVWMPSRMDFRRMPRDASFLRVVGRLRPGVTTAEARAEAALFAERQRTAHAIHREQRYEITLDSLQASLTKRHAATIWLLFGAVGFLLCIACTNLNNLLMTRSLARRREFAVRLALGSGRGRLVRQLLTESFLYALVGVGMALPLAHGLMKALIHSAPASLPRVADIRLQGTVFVFALVCAVVVASLVALVPAIWLTPGSESKSLRTAGRASIGGAARSWDHALVVVEVALSVVLLVGTALVLRSLVRLLEVDAGFRAERVLTSELYLTERRYPRYPRADARVRFARQLTERVERLPGVERAALALVVPLGRQDAGHTYASEEMAASRLVLPSAKYRPVTPGYFAAVGTELLAGRGFVWDDREQDKLVSIVDARLARRAWPAQDPLGKRLRVEVWSTTGGEIHLQPLWTEVIGVAENVRSGSLAADDAETVYLPYALYAVAELSLIVRSSSDPSALSEPIRREAARVDPDVALFNLRLMEDLVADSVAPQRFSLDLLGTFGVTGLALALIGVYGVLSHSVTLRQREIGIRMALGALPGDVLRLVLEKGARFVGGGIVLGLLAASALSRYLESQLYEVRPIDASLYAVVAALVVMIGLAACYLPARRASKIDPMATLRLD